MKNLLKQTFELWVKMRWLKTIDKEVEKMRKYKTKYLQKRYVVDQLWGYYNRKYSDSTTKSEDTV